MKHLIDFIFLAILVDVVSGCPRWDRQALRMRLALIGVYVIASLALWIAARWLLIPKGLEHLSPQIYVFMVLGMLDVARLSWGKWLWGNSEQEPAPLLLGFGVLTLLGIPLLDHAGQLPLLNYLLSVAGAGVGWLGVSYIMSTLGDDLRAEGVPRPMHGRCGLVITAGILYWAFMGFFNVGFI